MNEIRLRDINFSELRKLNGNGLMSTIYTDGDVCYKIFKDVHSFDNKDLYAKFRDLEGVNLDGVIMPIDLIMEDDVLWGYTMLNYINSCTLFTKFSTCRVYDAHELLMIFNRASNILRNLHSQGVICQDLNSDNILINNTGEVKFCDIDGYSYKGHRSELYSKLFARFLTEYRKCKVSTFEDVDKLTMLLTFYDMVFDFEVQDVPRRQYNRLACKLNTLNNLRSNYRLLRDKRRPIEDLPYLDEVIDLSDNCIVDKDKILTVKQKVLRLLD